MTQTEKGMEKIMERLQLEQYLSRGVENIIKGMKKASFTNPRSAMYLLKYAKAAGRAAGKRRQAEQNGKHVPPFPDRQHNQPVQSSLQRVLRPGKSHLRQRGSWDRDACRTVG